MLLINQNQQKTISFQCKIKQFKRVSSKITTQERNNLINPIKNTEASEWKELKNFFENLLYKLSK